MCLVNGRSPLTRGLGFRHAAGPGLTMEARSHAAAAAESRGGKFCPSAVKAELVKDVDKWNPEDLDVDGFPDGETEDRTKLWGLVLEEIAGEEDPSPIGEADLFRFIMWAKKPVDSPAGSVGRALPDVSLEVDGTLDGSKSEKTDKSKSGKSKLSPAALQDMAAQKATASGQIGYLNAALYLGYHPSKAECCDLEYGDSAIASKVIQKIAKLPGTMTIVESLAQCRSQQSVAPLETFFSRLVDSLTNVADDHADFAPIAAGRVAQFLSRVRNAAEHDMAVVYYAEEYLLRSYRGRGLPTPMDHELLKRAEKMASQANAGGATSGSAAAGGSSAAAKAPQSESLTAMAEQLKEVTKAMQSLSKLEGRLEKVEQKVGSQTSALEQKLSSLDSRMSSQTATFSNKLEALSGRIPPKDSGMTPEQIAARDKNMTCTICGEKGHRATHCPNK